VGIEVVVQVAPLNLVVEVVVDHNSVVVDNAVVVDNSVRVVEEVSTGVLCGLPGHLEIVSDVPRILVHRPVLVP